MKDSTSTALALLLSALLVLVEMLVLVRTGLWLTVTMR